MLALAACQTTIPNIRVHKEIPFLDGAEGVYVESATWKEGLIAHEEWEKMKPMMLMISPEGWKLIKDQWYEACRKAAVGGEKCTSQVDSIDGLVRALDKITESIILKQP